MKGRDKGRTDREVRREIEGRLEAAGDVDVEGIDVLVAEGIVSLVGHVPDFDVRRRIVAICEATVGVLGIHDRLALANDTSVDAEEVPPAAMPRSRRGRGVGTPRQ